MKLLLVIFSIAGLAAAAPTRALVDDMLDIIQLMPLSDMRAILERYADIDSDVQEVLEYLKGDEWANLVEYIRQQETWITFKEYMRENDIDLEEIYEIIADYVSGLGPSTLKTRSLGDMMDEIAAIFPTDEILTAIYDKLATSADAQEFYTVISSQEAYEFVEDIRALDQVQYMAQRLREMGADVDRYVSFIYAFLGWEY